MITSLALLHHPLPHTSNYNPSCAWIDPAAMMRNVMPEEYTAFHDHHASAALSQMLGNATDLKTSEDTIQLPASEEWDSAKEKKYYGLVEREALGKLRHKETQELERLAAQRRTRKNPRTGEEVIKEFEQRQLTRSLVEALTKYVNFHQPTHRSR